MNFTGKTVLVVGGSGVLGGGLVRELASRGAKALATCSSQATAANVPDEAALKLMVDLTNPQSIDVLADYLIETGELDGIVLAAGRVGFGASQQTGPAETALLAQVNYLGQAHLVSRLTPLLAKGREPFVAAITGVVAEKTFPGMAAYSASKTALSAWLSTLRFELRRDGVFVLEARPGHTETGLATRPAFGTAPAMPTGMQPEHVISVITAALERGETLLESSAF